MSKLKGDNMKTGEALAVSTHHLKQANTFLDVAMKAPDRELARVSIHLAIYDLLQALEDNSTGSP